MKKYLLAILIILLLTFPAFGANTVASDDNFISIILDGATDWDSSVAFPSGIRVAAIEFYPSAINDVLVIRNKTATGVFAFKAKDVIGGGVAMPFSKGAWKPYIKWSDQTVTTPANALIIIHRQAQTQ